jgi:cation diffusion facilitator family transporter
MTLLAVRFSARPPDRTHLYGHGKVENLSALFETLLLLATCGWIVWEAVRRLLVREVQVDVTVWSFAVMAVSIAVDYSRSRVLRRAAEKFNSQALEADALHFETDIWSSTVVIGGLIAIKLAESFPRLGFLRKGDALAALGVCGLVIWVSVQLGRRTVDALLDHAPPGMVEAITEVVSMVPGVVDCHNVRVRRSGPDLFVDLHVHMGGEQSLARAHELTETIESAVQRVVPGADVTVHPEPL